MKNVRLQILFLKKVTKNKEKCNHTKNIIKNSYKKVLQ